MTDRLEASGAQEEPVDDRGQAERRIDPVGADDRQLDRAGHPRRITVRLERRACSPVLRGASLPPATTVPWWGNRTLRYELG